VAQGGGTARRAILRGRARLRGYGASGKSEGGERH
jgi:hypothetical protein